MKIGEKINHKGVREALYSLINSHAYFASVAVQQNIVEDTTCDTFYVDGTKLGYNPTFADSLTFEEIKGILAHEISHLTLLHHVRMPDECKANKELFDIWNQACDLAINPILIKSGFTLPKGVLIKAEYLNKNTEDIYRTLRQEKEQEKQKNGNKQGQNDKGQPGQNKAENDESGDNEPGDSNSGKEEKAKNFGEVRAPTDKKEAEEKAKQQAKQAEMIAKNCGDGSANAIIPVAAESRKPQYDWRDILNRFVSDICAKDYSFLRVNKRHLQRGIILPSLYSRTFGKIVLAIDTSGSISKREVSAMVTEILHCLDTMMEDKGNVELTVIYCDDAVTNVEILTGADDKPMPRGGGGTSYKPVFDYIEKNDINCEAIIYLTDGDVYGNVYGDEPSYPVLWGLIRQNKGFNPPFGEVINVRMF